MPTAKKRSEMEAKYNRLFDCHKSEDKKNYSPELFKDVNCTFAIEGNVIAKGKGKIRLDLFYPEIKKTDWQFTPVKNLKEFCPNCGHDLSKPIEVDPSKMLPGLKTMQAQFEKDTEKYCKLRQRALSKVNQALKRKIGGGDELDIFLIAFDVGYYEKWRPSKKTIEKGDTSERNSKI